jgi:hypothetical protein
MESAHWPAVLGKQVDVAASYFEPLEIIVMVEIGKEQDSRTKYQVVGVLGEELGFSDMLDVRYADTTRCKGVLYLKEREHRQHKKSSLLYTCTYLVNLATKMYSTPRVNREDVATGVSVLQPRSTITKRHVKKSMQ